jgi:hypothetical protein
MKASGANPGLILVRREKKIKRYFKKEEKRKKEKTFIKHRESRESREIYRTLMTLIIMNYLIKKFTNSEQ